MTAWGAYVLTEFPEVEPLARITLLEDPDTLLADESIFVRLAERGYKVVEFTSTVALRYLYESYIRPSTDSLLVVIFRHEEVIEEVVPPDIRAGIIARRKSFSMSELFPHLDYGVLSELDRQYVTKLFEIRDESADRGGGEEATCEFIFEDFLGESVTSVRNVNELLKILYCVHIRYGIRSRKLLGYLCDNIRNKTHFRGHAMDEILLSAAKFREWVQYAWDVCYLKGTREDVPCAKSLAWEIDFKDREVKDILRQLYQNDCLEMRGDIEQLEKQYDYLAAGRERGKQILDLPLKDLMDGGLPRVEASWGKWVRFAREWAKFIAIKDGRKIQVKDFEKSRDEVNGCFWEWLQLNYSSLDSVPAKTPVMVSHTIRCLAQMRREEGLKKVALIVMDGLAWNQWIPIRQAIESGFSLTVNGSFAWVPTLTSISRQAIFSGKAPVDFAGSIRTTNKEGALWRQAWEREGVDSARVYYSRGHGMKDDLEELNEKLFTGIDVAGLVVDTVDEAVHGQIFGNVGMHENIQLWLKAGYLKRLLELLVDTLGYTVFITSDHGNVECTGIGAVSEGVLAEMRGERVRVYENEVLRGQRLDKTPRTRAWDCAGLPENFKAVVLNGCVAFTASGETCLAHGGASIEEVIVPFVRVDRK